MGVCRACLLLQCLAQRVLLRLQLERRLLQRVRVAAVPVLCGAASLVTLALVLAAAEGVGALDGFLLLGLLLLGLVLTAAGERKCWQIGARRVSRLRAQS